MVCSIALARCHVCARFGKRQMALTADQVTLASQHFQQVVKVWINLCLLLLDGKGYQQVGAGAAGAGAAMHHSWAVLWVACAQLLFQTHQ